jgi:YVTN family beta-propeller protein
MRMVQSHAVVALARPGHPQKGGGIKRLAFALSLACLFVPASVRAQNAYITNSGDNTVSVIDTASNTVVGSQIPVNFGPQGVAVTPDGSKVYVTNAGSGTVSVIATATNTVVGSQIPVDFGPQGVAVTPDGSKVYVANEGSGTVSVIDTATNTVGGSPIIVTGIPFGVAVTPDGSKVYVGNQGSNTVSVIDTATNTVVGSPITVGANPVGVAVTPDGSKVYVANRGSNTVSVIATATNTVVGSPITVGNSPIAFGLFIQPVRVFSAFAAQLTVYPNQKEFSIKSNFTLATSSNGINPPTEPVTLQVGSFKITIPPGSFVNVPGVPGYFTFVGVINGVSLNVLIRLTSANQYIFGVIAKNVSLTIPNPPDTVPVALTIGGDSGTTSVTPVIINTG